MMDKLLKISFVGDIMCLKEQLAAVQVTTDRQAAFNSIFSQVKPLLSDSDFVVGNLETPVCDGVLSSHSINFNTPIEFLIACRQSGFDFLSTANNHCLDRGIEGMEQTISNLDKLGLCHSGTYASEKKSEDIEIINIGGKKFAFICCTYGTNSEVNGEILPHDQLWRVDLLKKQNKLAKARFNPDGEGGHKVIVDSVNPAALSNPVNYKYLSRILAKVRRAKEVADIVIVMPHIGGQYNFVPGRYTKYIISEFVKERPSLIVAGHPHVPLRYEKVRDVDCAYSLGNFSFTPGVGYYLPNVLAEYGVIFHSYWNTEDASLCKLAFSIVANHVDNDGISKVVPVQVHYDNQKTMIEKDRVHHDAESVAIRFASGLVENPLEKEIILK